MALFSRLFGSGTPPTPPAPPARIDPALGDPRARSLRTRIERGDWAGVAAVLERVTDLRERGFLASALFTWKGRPEWLDTWVEQRGESSSLPWLIRGAHSIEWAWEARTGGRATEVAEEAWPVFFSRLREAEADLQRAAELDPADATPFGRLVIAAMGLQLGVAEVRARCEAGTRRDPAHWPTHRDTLNALAEKWGGSHDEMFGFAREAADEAPPASGLAALVAIAHVERWLYFGMEDDREGAVAYAEEPGVLEEIQEAWARSFGVAARAGGRWAPAQRNLFAAAFWLFGDLDAAGRELAALSGVLTEVPWCYWDADAPSAFDRARRDCGLMR